MDKTFDKTVKQARKNARDIARDLEYQEGVVADLKKQGKSTEEAEVLAWKIRGLLHKAYELVRAAELNREQYLETRVQGLSALTAGGASFTAAEKVLEALEKGAAAVKDRGGTDDEAIAEGTRQFIATARTTGDPCLEKVADAFASLEGLE